MADILKIEPSSLRNPINYDVVLKFDKPKEVEGNWGPQWMYGVEYNGSDHTIYATKGLHRAIEETGAEKGDTLSIIRVGTGKETRWNVLKNGEVSEEEVNSAPDPFVTGDSRFPQPKPDARSMFITNLKRYKVAFKKAIDFREDMKEDLDLNAVAFTFYKMAQDAKFDLLELDEGNE